MRSINSHLDALIELRWNSNQNTARFWLAGQSSLGRLQASRKNDHLLNSVKDNEECQELAKFYVCKLLLSSTLEPNYICIKKNALLIKRLSNLHELLQLVLLEPDRRHPGFRRHIFVALVWTVKRREPGYPYPLNVGRRLVN